MKRIISNGKTVWRGEDYVVDGQPGAVELPAILAEEVDDGPPAVGESQHYSKDWKLIGDKYTAVYSIHDQVDVVPESVEAWQAKYILKQSGFYDAVVAAIQQLPQPEKDIAIFAWNGNTSFERQGSLVKLLIEKISGLDDQVADSLFIEASKLKK